MIYLHVMKKPGGVGAPCVSAAAPVGIWEQSLDIGS